MALSFAPAAKENNLSHVLGAGIPHAHPNSMDEKVTQAIKLNSKKHEPTASLTSYPFQLKALMGNFRK